MRLANLTSMSLLLFLSMTLTYLVWASNRGLDITDEGYFLTASQYPYEVDAWPNVTHIYTGMLFNATSYNVAAFRIAGIALTLISGIIFSIGLWCIMRVVLVQDILQDTGIPIVLFICIGAMLSYIIGLITPNYNSINTCVLTLSSGLIFFGLLGLSGNLKRWIIYSVVLIAGLAVGISFFIRFPTGILLAVAYSILFLVWPGFSRQQRSWLLTGLGIGISGWLCFHFLMFQSPQKWWYIYKRGIELFAVYGHSLNLLSGYLRQTIKLFMAAFYHYWVLHVVMLFGFITLRWLRSRGYKVHWLPSVFILIVFLLAAWQSYLLGYYLGGGWFTNISMKFYAAWLLLLLNALACSYWYKDSSTKKIDMLALRRQGLLGLILFALPFMGAIGTNNVIILNMTFNIISWFGLLVFVLVLLSANLHNRGILYSGMLVIGGFACSQLVSSGLISPYRLNGGLMQQTIPTEIGAPATWLKLDPASSEFFVKIRLLAAQHGFKPGDDVLGFFDMPGVVYALGGKTLGIPWLSDVPSRVNEIALASVKQDRLKHAFVLVSNREYQSLPDLFRVLNMDFPRGYILCGQVRWPLTGESISLWKPDN